MHRRPIIYFLGMMIPAALLLWLGANMAMIEKATFARSLLAVLVITLTGFSFSFYSWFVNRKITILIFFAGLFFAVLFTAVVFDTVFLKALLAWIFAGLAELVLLAFLLKG